MQETVGVILLALQDGVFPKVMTLRAKFCSIYCVSKAGRRAQDAV
jgi:hypothetical protein